MILYLFLHLGNPTFERFYLNQQVSLSLSNHILLHKRLVTLTYSLSRCLAFPLLIGLELFDNGLLIPDHLLLLLNLKLQYVIFLFEVNHALGQLVDLLGVKILCSPRNRVRIDLVSGARCKCCSSKIIVSDLVMLRQVLIVQHVVLIDDLSGATNYCEL